MRSRLLGMCAIVGLLAPIMQPFAACAQEAPARPSTLTAALVDAYENNATLLEQRANLRATDENVPAALSGWRPTVVAQGSVGRASGVSEQSFNQTNIFTGQTNLTKSKIQQSRDQATGQITLTQQIFNGGKTVASVREAKNQVFAARAQLLSSEQTVFLNVVSAYVGVITDTQLLALDTNNEGVLRQQLDATNSQFKVGEITMTSVAQAQASLAQAIEQREVAQGNLQIARETFRQLVGAYPADHLVPPQPLALPVASKEAAAQQAAFNNPNIIAALFTDAADKDAVDVAFSVLAPQIDVQASAFTESNPSGPHTAANGSQVLANLTVPLFQGGSEYAGIRQARDKEQDGRAAIIDARRTAVQQATQAWEALIASQAAIRSTKVAVKSNAIALDGTEREEIVGTRTTLDVLNAQQALLSSQVQQIQNISNMVTESYTVAAAIGRLTASDLALPVARYDDLKYYNAVKNAWVGLGGAAFQDVGIKPDGSPLGTPTDGISSGGMMQK
ncbi:MAG: channel protein TolC [Rhodospirillales bacterium 20-60-12]|nr:MAG: channel protein TolC [Rhodospirillales bacterium 20-60-12]HQT67416.1 TolC family outer membrane protein [Acetobacteraceae bacterium]